MVLYLCYIILFCVFLLVHFIVSYVLINIASLCFFPLLCDYPCIYPAVCPVLYLYLHPPVLSLCVLPDYKCLYFLSVSCVLSFVSCCWVAYFLCTGFLDVCLSSTSDFPVINLHTLLRLCVHFRPTLLCSCAQ